MLNQATASLETDFATKLPVNNGKRKSRRSKPATFLRAFLRSIAVIALILCVVNPPTADAVPLYRTPRHHHIQKRGFFDDVGDFFKGALDKVGNFFEEEVKTRINSVVSLGKSIAGAANSLVHGDFGGVLDNVKSGYVGYAGMMGGSMAKVVSESVVRSTEGIVNNFANGDVGGGFLGTLNFVTGSDAIGAGMAHAMKQTGLDKPIGTC
jgi:hypothetical protein